MDQRRNELNCHHTDAKCFLTGALTALVCFSGSTLFAAAGETLIDRVVASVDSKPVLFSDVKKKVDKGPLIIISEFPAKADDKPFDKALYDAINFQIILTKAKEFDIEISDDELEKQIAQFLKDKNLNKEGLVQFLSQEGQTYEEYKQDFRNQMILRRFQGKVIYPLVKITDKDVETYYLSSSGVISNVMELTLRQILLNVDAKASPDIKEQKEKTLKEINQKLSSGMKFEDAVKIYSDDPSARESGGLMSDIRLKDLTPAIRAAVEPLKPGDFSPPVPFEGGYRIFQLVDRKVAGNQEFKDKKAQLQKQLEVIELNNQTNKWLAQQRQRTNIKIQKD